jgi:hypothetical protein
MNTDKHGYGIEEEATAQKLVPLTEKFWNRKMGDDF